MDTVPIDFYNEDGTEFLFTVDVPKITIDTLQEYADAKGITLEEEIINAIRVGITEELE